ncbi:hypothetical protein QAD02_012745 [Eretmocerus hayati]|uniref:Uncharacterized protein n=1 Tax=Eretmocerus hayati TaxID=131215 RepID=A0ACC2P0K0_9HYME|nr:hypothetical protein QAD02_012745 [Eretmocerus hayati]
MAVLVRSETGGFLIRKYLERLEEETYRSDTWKEVAQKYMNTSRSGTPETRVKLLHWRFQQWNEGIYTLLNIKENKTCKNTKSKKNVPEKQVLLSDNTRIGQRNLEVELWRPRNKFPPNFPALQSSIAGHPVNQLSFESLELNEKIDDVIMNTYLQLICCQAREEIQQNILPFDVHLVLTMIRYGKLRGFVEWASRVKLDEYKIWFLPINHEEHWTLLIVVPGQKLSIYLDSMQGRIIPSYLPRVCSFIRLYYSSGKRIRFTEWTLFSPLDIPHQYRGEGESRLLTMNCGLHVITWCYIICTGEHRAFDDYSMDSTRRRIAEVLVLNNGFQDSTHTIGQLMRLRSRSRVDPDLILRPLRVSQKSTFPMLGYANTFELCASLHKL